MRTASVKRSRSLFASAAAAKTSASGRGRQCLLPSLSPADTVSTARALPPLGSSLMENAAQGMTPAPCLPFQSPHS